MVGGDAKIYKKSKKLLRTMGSNFSRIKWFRSNSKIMQSNNSWVTIGAVAEAIILFEKMAQNLLNLLKHSEEV